MSKVNDTAMQTLLLVFIPTSKSYVPFLPWYLWHGCLSSTIQENWQAGILPKYLETLARVRALLPAAVPPSEPSLTAQTSAGLPGEQPQECSARLR